MQVADEEDLKNRYYGMNLQISQGALLIVTTKREKRKNIRKKPQNLYTGRSRIL